MRTRDLERLLVEAESKLQRTHDVLGTLISWMVQSANSPIRRDEAMELLKKLGR
jgi:hypothetical protein